MSDGTRDEPSWPSAPYDPRMPEPPPISSALPPTGARVLAFLRGSEGMLHAAMSGSGATCFALYETLQLAERAAGRVPRPWWHHAGALAG